MKDTNIVPQHSRKKVENVLWLLNVKGLLMWFVRYTVCIDYVNIVHDNYVCLSH